ncbi:hypothetical protein [Amycolatopsis marina]|uniref:hypothetical protein n=1 Tax=Amycolatopsis marina TaxID=490629 RepID=UPI0011608C2B|nr:hypothetical protein [Amycolatopsis marina]
MSSFTVEREASCLEPIAPFEETRVIKWNNGTSSTFTYLATVSSLPGLDVVTKTGTITGGEFKGSGAQSTQVGPALNLLDCFSVEGIQKQSALGTFAII